MHDPTVFCKMNEEKEKMKMMKNISTLSLLICVVDKHE